MDTVTVKPRDLVPADYNPRLALRPGDPEYDALVKSIEKFGLVEPIVWNERSGRVVGGHQRLQVLIDLGWGDKDITVSRVDLDEADERALNVALNKIEGRWDDNKLAELLTQIDDSQLLDLTGFTAMEMDDVLRRADQASATSFLDDFLGGLGDDPTHDPISDGDQDADGQPVAPTSLPPGQDGKAWFNLSYSVTAEDREIILAGLRIAKEHYGLQTAPKALVYVMRDLAGFLANADTPDPADADAESPA